MICDDQTNAVYISSLLDGKFPQVAADLERILDKHDIPLRRIEGTKDIWCRDYMPVQVDAEDFLWFRYHPDYLEGSREKETTPDDIVPIPLLDKYRTSPLVVDGGNVVGWEDRCIMTWKGYSENPRIPRPQLRSGLRSRLKVETLVLIPPEPDDKYGHADGVVRFIDRGTVLVNDYTKTDPRYGLRVETNLQQAGLKCVRLPYVPEEEPSRPEIPATGDYANYLRVRGLVVMPRYALPQDKKAMRIVKEHIPGSEVISVDCRELAMEGGVLNCVTWSVLDRGLGSG